MQNRSRKVLAIGSATRFVIVRYTFLGAEGIARVNRAHSKLWVTGL